MLLLLSFLSVIIFLIISKLLTVVFIFLSYTLYSKKMSVVFGYLIGP